jgi:hypothetical protein
MRTYVVMTLWVVLAFAPGLARAQEPEALRKELEQLRRQQEQYQKTIETLSERLQRLEAQPRQPAAPAPVTPPPVTQAPVNPQSQMSPISPMDLLRPRQPFALYQQRGSGQLLFDMGISADFVGNFTQRNVDKANAGSFPGRENRFFPREVELNLFGQIDPYASGVVRIETGEEDAGEARVNLAEAYLTFLTLPFGTQVRVGQMRNRFGLLNQSHRDGLPQPDVPNVLLRFFGEEGLVERGAELTWVAPLPFYLEALVGVFNGDNEEAFGFGKLNEPLVTGRLRTFFDITDEHAVQFGISGATGKNQDRLRTTLAGFDAKYKWRPDGWLHPLLTVGGEALWSFRRSNVEVDDDGDEVFDRIEKRRRDRFGWYTFAEVQPWRRWAFGARYDWTQFPVNPGREWAIEPYVTFFSSDFLRLRLAYKHTERTQREGFSENEGSGRIADEVFFQFTFVLGAHPAHPF